MKIRYTKEAPNRVFSHNGKRIQVGDEFDLNKPRAEELISQGYFEKVIQSRKTIGNETE